MIEKNTVLILGAGASHPFKYTLGRGLKTMIVQSANLNPNLVNGQYIKQDLVVIR